VFFRRKKTPPPAPPSAPSEQTLSRSNDATTQFLTGEAGLDRRSVEVLLDAIARVSQSRDLESLLDYIVDTSIEVTGAERGFLVLAGPGDELVIRVARQKGKGPLTEEPRFSTSVVRRVLDDGQPVRATVTSESEALELGTSVFDLKLRAVMCVPLSGRSSDSVSRDGDDDGSSAERGALYVDSKAATREFSQKDLSLFAALSQHISIALENTRLHLASVEKVRLENSLEIASAIQSGLMPRIPDDVPGYEVHGWYRPAERTSGDFFDFVRTKQGTWAVVVGDVTGHGIGPALITATAQASLRSYMKVLGEPGPVLSMLNNDLDERMEDGMFLTLFLCLLEPAGKVRVVNAGHTPPLVLRAGDGAIESLRGNAPALGMIRDFEYSEGDALALGVGDVLLAFTDGFVEARSIDAPDDLFDEAGMRRILSERGAAGATARELTEALVQAALEHAQGNSEDDMTVVAIRRTQ
jgi:serine phosphatase RsbU (regulator of sigma subunit)